MKKNFLKGTLLATLLIVFSGIVWAWGSWGHKHIDRAAVFALPESMRFFYYNHIDYITESSVIPDLRRPLTGDPTEAPKHFLDVENFGNIPLSEFPKTLAEAQEKYGKDFLKKNGTLPWNIEDLMAKLTRAFKSGNKSEILFLSSDIAHYIGDAHQPLHTSSNYNGQLSGQFGVHSLFESTIPSMFGKHYNFHTSAPQYISNISDYTWKMIAQSHNLLPALLKAEMSVREKFDTTTMYKRNANGQRIMFYKDPVYSDAYAAAFNKALGNMVEDQIRLSVWDIDNYWYTAWVNAGKPDLSKLDDPDLTRKNKKDYKKEYKAWQKGKLLYMNADKE
ncbi:MAG: hypothetical protein J0H55_12880 [Chitinophagaceae bacterium]|nr:hypothetical protein [Chitinophagaceae bacterium]